MSNPNFALVEPSAYRWAVHCYACKSDSSRGPERPVALFEHKSAAQHFGRLMWPDTFEVVDLQSHVGAGQ